MSAGFAIWREPGSSPVGIRGEFKCSCISESQMQDGFVFRPWNGNLRHFYLQGEYISDIALLRSLTTTAESYQTIDVSVMNRAEWGAYIGHIQHEISLGQVRKVVAARQSLCETRFSLFDAFLAACERYPDAYVSIVCHAQFGTWLGATPEILIQPEGADWKTVSMAGTLVNEQSDWTGKEKEENTATQQFLRQILAKMGAHIIETGPADAVRAGTLRHLVKQYRFSLQEKDIPHLIAELHPTPAVGGLPRDKALSIIANHEKQSRNLFSGYVGFYRADRPHLWVNLRCCEWRGQVAVLHAGAGINAQSDAGLEWEETAAKMQTIGICL
ncbi:MAG: hypothetical protein FJY15_08195 [Bacteroidetes bacterium]|nr:hypothetical protein [Bacteroidota bacterium]